MNKFRIKGLFPVMVLAAAMSFVSCDDNDSARENMDEATTEMMEEIEEMQVVADQKEAEMAAQKRVYTVADVDVQPLFGLECTAKEDPVACSNEQMLKFVKENAKFPKSASRKGQDGFEQVIVVIEKDGSLSDMKYVASSKTKDCDGCQQAAVDVVGMMKNWTPAKKNGKPVAVQMTIPVRFES